MKKISYLLFTILLSILLIPCVMAKNNVSIESMKLVDHSPNAKEKTKPTYEGLDMAFDLSYTYVNDFVKYKVVLKNDSNMNYKISDETKFSDSNHFKYTYEINENTLKAHSSLEMYVVVTYNTEVRIENYPGGIYNESNNASIVLIADGEETTSVDDTEKPPAGNPNTKTSIMLFIIFGISLVALISLIILFKHNAKVGSLMFVMALISVPLIVKAVEELRVKVNVKVEVVKRFKVIYEYDTFVFLTPEEYASNPLNADRCHSKPSYFISTGADGEKFYECYIEEIYVDPVEYAPGEEVEAKKFKYETYGCPKTWLSVSEGELCEAEKIPDTWEVSYWEYNIIEIERHEYTYFDNDGTVMNFRNEDIIDKWEQEGIITFPVRAVFTMPAHDVFITDVAGG